MRSGLAWGRETVWMDSEGRLAALKAVDAEFDHFEATRSGYSEFLSCFWSLSFSFSFLGGFS